MTVLASFFSMFPDADALMKMPPENVAPTLLRLALARGKGTPFLPKTLFEPSPVDSNAGRYYPNDKRLRVERFLGRVFEWIEDHMFWEPSPGSNGYRGWRLLTEAGEALARGEKMIPAGSVVAPSPVPARAPANSGGRPPADWWEDCLIDLCFKHFRGELPHRTQADIVRAIQDWATEHGHDVAESTAKLRARKLMDAIKRDGAEK